MSNQTKIKDLPYEIRRKACYWYQRQYSSKDDPYKHTVIEFGWGSTRETPEQWQEVYHGNYTNFPKNDDKYPDDFKGYLLPEEKELLEKAKKDYPIGTIYKCVLHCSENKVKQGNFEILEEAKTIYGDPGEGVLYNKGVWAEKISTTVIEETISEPSFPFKIGEEIEYFREATNEDWEGGVKAGLNVGHKSTVKNVGHPHGKKNNRCRLIITEGQFIEHVYNPWKATQTPKVEPVVSSVSDSLLEEAKRRYPIGTRYQPIGSFVTYIVEAQKFSMCGADIVHAEEGKGCLYKEGKWAEIKSIPEKWYLIVDDENHKLIEEFRGSSLDKKCNEVVLSRGTRDCIGSDEKDAISKGYTKISTELFKKHIYTKSIPTEPMPTKATQQNDYDKLPCWLHYGTSGVHEYVTKVEGGHYFVSHVYNSPDKYFPEEKCCKPLSSRHLITTDPGVIRKLEEKGWWPHPPKDGNSKVEPTKRIGQVYRVEKSAGTTIGTQGNIIVLCFDDASTGPGFCLLEDYKGELDRSQFNKISAMKANYVELDCLKLLSNDYNSYMRDHSINPASEIHLTAASAGAVLREDSPDIIHYRGGIDPYQKEPTHPQDQYHTSIATLGSLYKKSKVKKCSLSIATIDASPIEVKMYKQKRK